MEATRVRARVSGRVQGVWFRESTRRTAEALGLSGWVRNCRDGTVETEIEGSPEQVRAALEFLREGPPLARVAKVEVLAESEVAEPSQSGFRVRD